MSGDSYWQQLRSLEDRHRPQPLTVFPYLARTARSGLAKAARAAEDHADELDRLDPPREAVAAQREYADALRAVAHDARDLAEQKRWPSGRGLAKDLRALPSFQQMVEARQRLLERFSED
jgi:hypothetical protein